MQDKAIVTAERQLKLVRDQSEGEICNSLE